MSTMLYDKIQKMTAALLIVVMMLLCQCCAALASSVETVQVRSAPITSDSSARNGMVRVYLSSLGNPSSLDLRIEGNYSFNHNGQFISNGSQLNVAFSSATGEIKVTYGGQTYHVGKRFSLRRHSASGSNGVYITQSRDSQNPYPGDLSFEAVYEGGSYTLYTIAHIYIENYLYGVLPYEMGNSSGMEALKAQAVAARTYTVRMMQNRASNRYDVKDTTSDQVYRGTPSGNANCVAAVDGTKGIVLQYGGQYITTYYSASNGGQTEIGRSGNSFAYMKVKDDPFDYANASSTVKRKTLYANLTSSSNPSGFVSLLQSKAIDSLKRLGYQATTANTVIQTLKNVTPHTPMYASPSRLYTKMDFTFTVSTHNAAGQASLVTLSETCDIFTELESLLGMGIQSQQNELWSVQKKDTMFVLEARRYGHGMGMSQRGAMQMAKLGYTYDQILGFYYDGCTRVRQSFTNKILSASSTDQEITVEQPADIEQNQTENGQGSVVLAGNTNLLAIRSDASSAASVIGTAGNGAIVEVLTQTGSWYQIRFGELVGYVPVSALEVSGKPTGQAQEVTSVMGFAVVTANDYVNLRAHNSLSGKILGTAPSGAVLTVFSKNGSWAKVQYQSITAYASTNYLSSVTSQYPSSALSSGSRKAQVVTGDGTQTVNLRKTASTSADLVNRLQVGTVVTVVSDDGSWCQVVCGEGEGYILSSFLEYVDPTENEADDSDEQDETKPEQEQNAANALAVVHTKQGSLNLRAEPTTGSRVLTTIPKGMSVVVLAKGSEWTSVRYAGYDGYVMTSYLTFTTGNADVSDDHKNQTGQQSAVVVTPSGSLNLRQLPSTASAVLKQIPLYTVLTVLERKESWSRVEYQGISGYVMNSFLRFNETADDSQVENEPVLPEPEKAPAEYASKAIVSVQNGTVNLRRGPGVDDDVLAAVPNGTEVEVSTKGEEWCFVRYGEYEGYMMNRYLNFDIINTDASDPKQMWVATSDGSLNMRKEANGNAQIVTSIPRGAQVEVVLAGTEWSQIVWNGHNGFVMSRFLSAEKPSAEKNETSNSADKAADNDEEPVQPYVTLGGIVLDTSLASPASPLFVTVLETTALYPMCSQENAGMAVPAGETIEVLLKGDRWCRIAYQEQQGYCPTNHLDVR